MIIVNQTRNRIINFDNVLEIYIDDYSERVISLGIYISMGVHIVLGVYATKERAEEILKEIIEVYQLNKFCENATKAQTLDVIENRLEELKQKPFVYTMPEE